MRWTVRVLASALLLVVTAGCSDPGFENPSDESRLYVAVVNELLTPYFWGTDEEIVIFLSIGDNDPTAEFIAQFPDPRVDLRNGSDFTMGAGLHLSIVSVEWVDSDTVQVESVLYGGPLHGGGYAHRLSRRAEEWVLKEWTVRWIS